MLSGAAGRCREGDGETVDGRIGGSCAADAAGREGALLAIWGICSRRAGGVSMVRAFAEARATLRCFNKSFFIPG